MGPGLHPQYTRADFGQEAVGGLSSSRAQSTTRKTRNSHMEAEQEFKTTTQTQASQPASSAQCVPMECVPMECADVLDVCATRSRATIRSPLSSTTSRMTGIPTRS